MGKINCLVNKCSHNKSGECYANYIHVVGSSAKGDGDTCCGSFLNGLHYSELTNNTLSSSACECLQCIVETCTFNHNQGCTLDTIQVSGQNVESYTQTQCSSFKQQR